MLVVIITFYIEILEKLKFFITQTRNIINADSKNRQK